MLGGPADVVLSDMAANATGHRATDHLKIMALVEAAAEFAGEVLKPGGAFLAKVIQGGTEGALLASLKRDFATVKHVKPAASRSRLRGALRAGDRISQALTRRRDLASVMTWTSPAMTTVDSLRVRNRAIARLRAFATRPQAAGSSGQALLHV